MADASVDKAEQARIVAAVRALDSHTLAVQLVEEEDTHIRLEAAADDVAMIRWAVQSCWGTLEVLV